MAASTGTALRHTSLFTFLLFWNSAWQFAYDRLWTILFHSWYRRCLLYSNLCVPTMIIWHIKKLHTIIKQINLKLLFIWKYFLPPVTQNIKMLYFYSYAYIMPSKFKGSVNTWKNSSPIVIENIKILYFYSYAYINMLSKF